MAYWQTSPSLLNRNSLEKLFIIYIDELVRPIAIAIHIDYPRTQTLSALGAKFL